MSLTDEDKKWMIETFVNPVAASNNRLDRIEHLLAGHIEQAKKDYEENREFLRQYAIEWRQELKASQERWQRNMNDLREDAEARDREWDRRMEQSRKEWDRTRTEILGGLDARIGQLVTAIGDLIGKIK